MQRTAGPSRAQSSSLTQSSGIRLPAGEWVSLSVEKSKTVPCSGKTGEERRLCGGGRGGHPPQKNSVQRGILPSVVLQPEILLQVFTPAVPLLLAPRAGWGARAKDLKKWGSGIWGRHPWLEVRRLLFLPTFCIPSPYTADQDGWDTTPRKDRIEAERQDSNLHTARSSVSGPVVFKP